MLRCLRALAAAAVAAAGLTGCDLLSGGDDEERLEGERISVLDLEQQLKPDSDLSDTEVRLPRPYVNASWTQAGGTASHAMYHLALPETVTQAWRADVGTGGDAEQPILAQPVVADGRVFAMDADYNVSAHDTADGERLWRRDLDLRGEAGSAFGGGIAVADGRLFVTTGIGDLHALNAETGETVWTRETGTPIRAAPAVSDGNVYTTSVINETQAFSAEDGSPRWVHQGIEEQAGLLGTASPAVSGSSVVAAYSSGQLFSLFTENGRVLWNDSLAGINRASQVADMADIRGQPVIDRDRVFAVSNSGRMVAINARTGQRTWEAELASIETPWAAGPYLFVITNDARVAAVRREDGRVRWVTRVAAHEDPEDKEGPIHWQAPVLAGDRVILAGSHGVAASLSPYTGEFLGSIELPGPAAVQPVVADETLYFLTQNATLAAFR